MAHIYSHRLERRPCKRYRERSLRLGPREATMAQRVEGRTRVVVGGGQTPGQTIGNGRATATVLAREGARVCVVDRDLAAAQATVEAIKGEGGEAWAFEADITSEDAARRLMAA